MRTALAVVLSLYVGRVDRYPTLLAFSAPSANFFKKQNERKWGNIRLVPVRKL